MTIDNPSALSVRTNTRNEQHEQRTRQQEQVQQLRLQDSRKQSRRWNALQRPSEDRKAGQGMQHSQGQPQSNVDHTDSLTPNTKDAVTQCLFGLHATRWD